MKTVGRILVIAALAAAIPAPVFAQTADLLKDGDYYAPAKTVVQKASPQERGELKDGDYYAADKTVVQRPTQRELNQVREGDYYAPDADK